MTQLPTPLKEEYFSAYSHTVAFFVAIIGVVFLLLKTIASSENLGVIVIYCFVLCFLFAASALYHTFKKEENEQSFWRKLDHVAIFYMIAGTYTPLSRISMEMDNHWFTMGFCVHRDNSKSNYCKITQMARCYNISHHGMDDNTSNKTAVHTSSFIIIHCIIHWRDVLHHRSNFLCYKQTKTFSRSLCFS